MLELYGIKGQDIEIISFDINSLIVIVKDKINDITYKGQLDSFYSNSDQIVRTFSGEVADVKHSLKISFKDYEVIENE